MECHLYRSLYRLSFTKCCLQKYRFIFTQCGCLSISKHSNKKNGATFIVILQPALKSLFLLWNWDANAKLWNLRFEWTWFARKRTLFIDDKKEKLTLRFY
jgi:hypothetical protein